MHRIARKGAVFALLLSACSGGARTAGGPSPLRVTTTTDPYAVPATITIEYLNRVFVALEKINGDATRLIVANRRITPEAAKLLASIYTPDEFTHRADIWSRQVTDGLRNYKARPDDRRTTVRRVLVLRDDCVGVEVERDYSGVSTEVPRDPTERVSLVPAGGPLGWKISDQFHGTAAVCA